MTPEVSELGAWSVDDLSNATSGSAYAIRQSKKLTLLKMLRVEIYDCPRYLDFNFKIVSCL